MTKEGINFLPSHLLYVWPKIKVALEQEANAEQSLHQLTEILGETKTESKVPETLSKMVDKLNTNDDMLQSNK